MKTKRQLITSTLCVLSLVAALVPSQVLALGSTPVSVVNTTPITVADIDNPAKQPFQITIGPSSSSGNTAAASYTVPSGKRLVIEYYAAQLTQYPQGGYSYVYLVTTAGGSQVYYKIIPPVSTTTTFNQTTRIYADPGTDVQVLVTSSSSIGGAGASVNLSGYFVNVP